MTGYIPPEIGGTVEVKVSVFPHCDLCGRTAWYDAYGLDIGTWANLCEKCAEVNRIRLGTGAGQRFRLV